MLSENNEVLRVVFYLPTPGGLTGAPRRLLTLMTTLRQSNRYDVALIGDPHDELINEAKKKGIKTFIVPTGSLLSAKHGMLLNNSSIIFKIRVIWELLKYNLKIIQLLWDYNPHMIWVRGSKGIAFLGITVMLLRKPLVWDIDYEPPSKGVVALLHSLGLWLSDKVVLQYSAAGERIFGMKKVKKYQKKFISLIPGIDLKRLSVYRKLRNRKISKISNNNDLKIFRMLQVGSICERKNQRFALRLLRELKNMHPSKKFELLIAGDEYDRFYSEILRKEINELGLNENVKLLGWRDDIPELLVEADLLLLPSKDEGVPNVIQEAMYIGCPVLASDVGGIPEIIRDGETGWIVPINNPKDWAERVFWLILNPEKHVAVARKAAKYAELFAAENWVNNYSKILLGLYIRRYC